MNAPMTPEQRKAIACQLGDVKPATDALVGSFAEAVANVRNHEHPSWEDLYCMNLTSYMGERMAPVLRRLLDAELKVAELEAQVRTLAVDAQGALPMPAGSREDPHDGPLHSSYTLGHDLPEIPAQRDQRWQA